MQPWGHKSTALGVYRIVVNVRNFLFVKILEIDRQFSNYLFIYWRLIAQSTYRIVVNVRNFFFVKILEIDRQFSNYLFIYWRLIAQSTAQGHLRAFH